MNHFSYFRKRSGLRQEDVARALGIDRSAVALWELGINRPNTRRLPAIAKLYGCTVDELLDSEEPESEYE